MSKSLELLQTLRRSVDEAFLRAQGTCELVCGEGCDQCCRVDLSVFPVEAAPLRELLASLDQDRVQAIWARLESQQHCAFLVEGRCAVYDQRPIICRSQGMPLLLPDGSRDICPENPDPATLPLEAHLALERLNTLLAILHRAHLQETGLEDGRVRLADLAREALSPRAGGVH